MRDQDLRNLEFRDYGFKCITKAAKVKTLEGKTIMVKASSHLTSKLKACKTERQRRFLNLYLVSDEKKKTKQLDEMELVKLIGEAAFNGLPVNLN
jgi:hypothetical protein